MFKDDEDFYIKINNGDIVTENKSNNIDFINDNRNYEEVNNIPDYNSPEYAEYINRLNRESLRDINSEDVSNTESTINITKELKEKYPKKKIQLLIFGLIIVLFIAILGVSGSMMRSVSDIKGVGTSATNEDFKFITDVASASATDSIERYNNLKNIVSNKSSLNSYEYKKEIQAIKESAQNSLNDVHSLSSYINISEYSSIAEVLEKRYLNLIDLCDELLQVVNLNPVSTYNSYVTIESSIVDELNDSITKKASELNIGYKVDGNNIVIYVD